MKLSFRILSIGISFLFIIAFILKWHGITGGFHPQKFRCDFAQTAGLQSMQQSSNGLHLNGFACDVLTDEIEKMLDQPFSYFNKGNQAYVFSSQDGKYVLKIIRHQKYRPPFWSKLFPQMEKTKKNLLHKKETWEQSLFSYGVASNGLKDACQTLYSHLHLTQCHNKTLLLKDHLGRKWNFDLDKNTYLLQIRGDSILSEALLTQKRNQDLASAEKIIQSFQKTITAMADQGVYMRPKNCFFNLGVKDNLVQIFDLGGFRKIDPSVNSKEKILSQYNIVLKKWCEKLFPEMVDFIEELPLKE